MQRYLERFICLLIIVIGFYHLYRMMDVFGVALGLAILIIAYIYFDAIVTFLERFRRRQKQKRKAGNTTKRQTEMVNYMVFEAMFRIQRQHPNLSKQMHKAIAEGLSRASHRYYASVVSDRDNINKTAIERHIQILTDSGMASIEHFLSRINSDDYLAEMTYLIDNHDYYQKAKR